MSLFQTIWTFLTTPNEGLIGIIFNNWGIPFIFVESYLHILIFTTIFDIKSTKKQQFLCVCYLSLLACISNTFFSKPYSSYVDMLIYPVCVMLVFKMNPLKAILSEFIPTTAIAILETIYCRLAISIFGISYYELYMTPLSRLFITFLIYISLYLIYRAIKYYKLNITFIENMGKKNKIILIVNFVFAIITIAVQFYIIGYYMNNFPLFITILSVMSLIVYSFISIFSLLKTTKLEETTQSLEKAQLYNKTLNLLHDNLRTFRHEYANTMQAIGGYISNNDIEGLKIYYKSIEKEYRNLNNLTALSPKLISDSGLYSLIASKYLLAEEAGITFNVNICVDFNHINASPYVLTRILGILLDNAIDASKNSKEKEISFEVTGFSKNANIKKHVISIFNTYSNKDVDLDRIREKGYTSKTEEEGSHGLGLWEVNKILKKSKNLNLHTDKNDKYFIQDLEIFDIA